MTTKDLLLNPCGDLTIEEGKLVFVTDASRIRQKWLIRVRTFKGEWVLDANIGVPYFQEIFEKNVDKAHVEDIFRKLTLSTEGVIAVESVVLNDIDRATRSVNVAVEAQIEGPDNATFFYDGSLTVGDCPLTPVPDFPATVEGLTIWFDAQDPTATFDTPTSVSMQNKAGQGVADSAGTVGQPVLVGSSPINGHRAIFFNNDTPTNAQRLDFSGTPAIRNTGAITIFVVHNVIQRSAPPPAEDFGLVSLDAIESGIKAHLNTNYQVDGLQTNIELQSEQVSGASTSLVTGTSGFLYIPEISSASVTYSPLNSDFRRNGSLQSVSGSLAARLFDGNGFIGAGIDATDSLTDFVNGYIGEVLVYDRRLSNDEIQSLTDYLSIKWGITEPEVEAGPGYGYFPYGESAFGL